MVHLATAAVVNAVWDLVAKIDGKPLWKLLADMSPDDLIAAIDFRYITDAITPDEALALLRERAPSREEHEQMVRERGIPAYTTSAGWLGYTDDEIRVRCREAIAGGWMHFKIKVGASLVDDLQRVALVREEIGAGRTLMLDANGAWDVGEAVERMRELARFNPLWIEADEPRRHPLVHGAIGP